MAASLFTMTWKLSSPRAPLATESASPVPMTQVTVRVVSSKLTLAASPRPASSESATRSTPAGRRSVTVTLSQASALPSSSVALFTQLTR